MELMTSDTKLYTKNKQIDTVTTLSNCLTNNECAINHDIQQRKKLLPYYFRKRYGLKYMDDIIVLHKGH